MPISTTLVRKLNEIDPRLREVLLLLVEEVEKQWEQLSRQVTKEEFAELKQVVEDLSRSVAELAEAQRRTEERVNELAEAQRRTEERVNELAEAQRRTEEELRKLAADQREVRRRLEGLSDTVGYTLENRAYQTLPYLLRAEGVEVEGYLERRYVQVRGRERQVNIFGYGRRGGQRVLILGEAKTRPSRKEVDRFARLIERMETQEGLPVVAVFVAHDFAPPVEAYVRQRGIRPVWSFELDRVA